MKKVLTLIIALVGSATMSLAQDIITLRSGDEIKALVQEVGATEVRYKKFENATGPIYVLQKAEIFMIKYANGERDVFTVPVATPPVTTPPVNASGTSAATPPVNANGKQEREAPPLTSRGGVVRNAETNETLDKGVVRYMMERNPEALELYNRARTMKTFGTVSCCLGALMVTPVLFGWDVDDAAKDTLLVGGLFFVGAGFFVTWLGVKDVNSSVKVYNDSLPGRPSAFTHDLRFGLTSSGSVGFTLTF
jgi:hypothetical protein